MSDMVTQHNIAALVSLRLASAVAGVVAGGAGDAAAIAGIAFDRAALKLPRTLALSLVYTATLAATRTLSLGTVKIQDSADGATWADFLVFADPGVVATGAGTVSGQINLSAGINGARQFVRVVFTPDLSAANTDTASVAAIVAFGGFDRLPAP